MQLTLFQEPIQQAHDTIEYLNTSIPKDIIEIIKQTPVIAYGHQFSFNPVGKLSRDKYEQLKKFIEGLRGYWSRKEDTHLFNYDPTALIQKCLKAGKYPQPNPLAFFPTPKDVVDDLIVEAGLAEWFNYQRRQIHYNYRDVDGTMWESDWAIKAHRNLRVLEPSAGTGAIASEIRDKFSLAQIDVCELDPFNREVLEQQGFNLVGHNFLEASLEPVYDHIVMNPPFSVKGNVNAYITHIEKAFSLLRIGGKLSAVVPASMLWRTDKATTDFRNLVALYGSWDYLEKDAFVESGTATQCLIINMTKHNQQTVDSWFARHNGYPSWFCYELSLALDCEQEWHGFINGLGYKVGKGLNLCKALELAANEIDTWVMKFNKKGQHIYYTDLIKSQSLADVRKDLVEELEEDAA